MPIMVNKWIEIINWSVFMIEYFVNILDLTQQIFGILGSYPLVELVKLDLFPQWNVILLLPAVEPRKHLILYSCLEYSVYQVTAKYTEF